MKPENENDMNAIRPPVLRSSLTLDRSLFGRVLNVAAARVKESRDIARFRKALIQENDALRQHRLDLLRPDPDQKLAAEGRKCILLRPDVVFNSPETWGKVLKEAVAKDELSVIPYELYLDYDFWDYREVMQSVLPEEVHDCIPTGFNTVGHVAHLNLRDHALPYKKLIGEVLRDKNPQITTVINKIDQVGEGSEFRTFNYEVLAGEDDLNVEVREGGCVFRFDYAKVYWNSKLETEHTRLVELFRPGEVVCDVMAGVGPFALPAGRKGVFVWANDMNPESFRYLQTGIGLNKVGQFVRSFNDDGRLFIGHSVLSVLEASRGGEVARIPAKKVSRTQPGMSQPPDTIIPIPPTVSHFVMNLPASAITFLHHFRGIYAGHESLFAPATTAKLPVVHVYCFTRSSEDGAHLREISERISAELGFLVRPGNYEIDGEVSIYGVRDVAPNKHMFCASFRLPAEVAFAHAV